MSNNRLRFICSCLLAAFMVATFCTATAQEQTEQQTTTQHPEQSEKQQDIMKLLRLSGSGELGIQVMDQMLITFESSFSQVPQKFWDDFRKEIKSDDLLELIAPLYDKYFTHDDIRELIRFYESPIGKKMIMTMPLVMQESMSIGQQWGEEIGGRIMKRLKEEGYSEM